MTEVFFLDTEKEIQDQVANKLAAMYEFFTYGDVLRALRNVNPTIDPADNTLSWAGYCLVIGYAIGSIKLSPEVLHQVQVECRHKYDSYKSGEVMP